MDSRRKLLDLFCRRGGLLRTAEVRKLGVHHRWLARLVAEGAIERLRQGLYRLQEADPDSSLIVATRCVPHSVICLLSALSYHDLTTFNPPEIYLAVERGRRVPRIEYPPMRIVRFSGLALSAGVEEYDIEGTRVRVYNVAKTVADCFKYRHKIGLDVALEALKEGWRERRFTMDDLWQYGKICRVANIMRPYLEMLAS